MIALLNWRMWAASLMVIGLTASHWKAYKLGEAHDRLAFDAYKLTMMEAAEKAKLAIDAQNQAQAKQLEDAQNAHTTNIAKANADANRARTQLDSLRSAIAAISSNAPVTAIAANKRAVAIGELLDKCGAEYQGLARQADGHVADVKMLQAAWPK
jgi:hypothetical protein